MNSNNRAIPVVNASSALGRRTTSNVIEQMKKKLEDMEAEIVASNKRIAQLEESNQASPSRNTKRRIGRDNYTAVTITNFVCFSSD